MQPSCKHTRSVGIMDLRRCSRPAVRDGYCTRHHPSYLSPKEAAAMAELEREQDPVYRAEKWLDEAKAAHNQALRAISDAQDDAARCHEAVVACQDRLTRLKYPGLFPDQPQTPKR